MTIRQWLLAGIGAAALAGCVSVSDVSTPAAPYPAPALAGAPHGISQERLRNLDQTMKGYIDQGKLGGAVVMIHQDGREVFSEAYGWRDREAGDPMREDTIFRIASQSKALTSVAIMMLMEEGKLVLDDPLGKFLPEWMKTTVAVPRANGGYDLQSAKRPITIRDLLTHTAGISYGTGPGEKAWKEAGIYGWYFADKTEPVSEIVKRMARLPMAAQPGEQWVYGYNTDILGVVVEKLSGQTLDQFLHARLIEPLGMNDTSFCLPPEKASRFAVVYSMRDGKLERAPAPGAMQGTGHIGQGSYAGGPCVAFSGGAGLLSTAGDYAKFLEMLRNGGEAGGKRYLSRKSVELMTSDNLVTATYQPGMGFGLGFRIVTDLGKSGQPGSVGDYGWGGAYHSTYWVDPAEGLTVTYMTNIIPAGGLEDQAKIRALIYSALD
ncbi:MAG TPA: serine hydrolase domain-containing protein [Hyphomonadaceae bacterium]|nr:serine hydrolase domain-containing protein [Hyphomonadaceae bacterium]